MSKVAGKRTRDEVAGAIRGFTPTDRARLQSAARFYGRARGLEAEALLQEALMRAVDGRSSNSKQDAQKL